VQPDYDCVVVGAGLIGAAQALALSRNNLKVAVVDIREPLRGEAGGDVRGLALAPSSRRVIEGLDLWPKLAPRIVPIRHIHISDQGRFGFTRLNAADVDLDALGYVCPADDLLNVFEAALVEQCEVSWKTEVDGIDIAPDIARVRLRGESGATEITTRLVIGADGMGSPVREAIGVATQTRDYRQCAVVANVSLQYPVHETAFERFTVSGPLALLPLAGGRHVAIRCCGDTAVDELLKTSDEQYLNQLERGFGYRFGKFSDLGKRRSHKLVLGWADRVVDQRVALVGAAANTIHPNGAQGLNLGLRDVAVLADSVERSQRTGGDIGGEECLSDFARQRVNDQRDVIRFTDGLAQIFSSKLPLLGPLRNIAMVATDISPASKRWLIRRASGLFAESSLASAGVDG